MARTRQANLKIKELMLWHLNRWTWVSDQGRLYLNAADNTFLAEMGFRGEVDLEDTDRVRCVINGVTIGYGVRARRVSNRAKGGITYYSYEGEFRANAFLRLLSRVKHPPIAGHNPIAYGPGGIARPVGHAIFEPVPISESAANCIHKPCEDKTEQEREECECNAPTALRRDESNIQSAHSETYNPREDTEKETFLDPNTPERVRGRKENAEKIKAIQSQREEKPANESLRKRRTSERRKRLSVEEREEKRQTMWSWIGLAFFFVVVTIIGAC